MTKVANGYVYILFFLYQYAYRTVQKIKNREKGNRGEGRVWGKLLKKNWLVRGI